MCSWSASRWFRKRSGNTMIVSYAIEPVTSVFKCSAPASWKEEIHPVADGLQAAGVEIHAQWRVRAGADAARDLVGGQPRQILRRHEHTPRHRLVALIGERELERRILLRELRLVAQHRVQHDYAVAPAIGLQVGGFDCHQLGPARQLEIALERNAGRGKI